MTYEFYHSVKGGKTPPKASAYTGEEDEAQKGSAASAQEAFSDEGVKKYGWKCKVCGYIVEMDELPDNYLCPVCGAGKDMFERIEL